MYISINLGKPLLYFDRKFVKLIGSAVSTLDIMIQTLRITIARSILLNLRLSVADLESVLSIESDVKSEQKLKATGSK